MRKKIEALRKELQKFNKSNTISISNGVTEKDLDLAIAKLRSFSRAELDELCSDEEFYLCKYIGKILLTSSLGACYNIEEL